MTGTATGALLVIICAVLEGLGQVFLKKSMLPVFRRALWGSLGIAVLSLEAVAYSKALIYLDVSKAYTISSLNLLAVALFSQWLLREQLTKIRWFGICLIFAGVSLVMVRT